MPLATTWVDLETVKLSELSQRELLHDITYTQNILKKRNDTNELIYKTETDSHTERMNLRLPRGKYWGKG